MNLFQLINSDISRYRVGNRNTLLTLFKAMYIHPSLLGVIHYRIERALWLRKNNPLVIIFFVISRFIYPFVRIYSGLELSHRAIIGDSLYIGHFGPTIIHPDVIAGNHLTVMHGCTIGADNSGVPCLGNDVYIGTGASIFGYVRIGDSVFIGPGAVVTTDVESGVAISIPTRIIHSNK
jgi:serine O-acetyltransferase